MLRFCFVLLFLNRILYPIDSGQAEIILYPVVPFTYWMITAITLKPSLHTEQPQLSQPFLTGEIFHPSDHVHGTPLDPL